MNKEFEKYKTLVLPIYNKFKEKLTYRTNRFFRFWLIIKSICKERDIFSLSQSLSYVTVISIVPIFVLFFFVIGRITQDTEKQTILIDLISRFFLPEFASRLVELLNDLSNNVLGLGLIGFPSLIIIGIIIFLKVNNSINRLWSTLESRGIFKNLSVFISSIIIGPVLIIALLSIPSIPRSLNLDNVLGVNFSYYINLLIPFVILLLLLLLLYYYIPTEKVKLKSAFIGAIWGALLVRLDNILLGLYITNFSKYDLIYGPISILPIMLLWLYSMWLIVLFGSILVYVHQSFSHKQFVLNTKKYVSDSNINLSLKVLLYLTHIHKNRIDAPDLLSFCYAFNVEKQRMKKIVLQLIDSKIISQINDKKKVMSNSESRYQLFCDPSKILLSEIFNLFRSSNKNNLIIEDLNEFFYKLDLHPHISNPDSNLLSIYDLALQSENNVSFEVNNSLHLMEIKNFKVNCYVGINKLEEKVLQPVIIDIKLYFDANKATQTNDIADTINYSSLCQMLKTKLNKKKFILLESMLEGVIKIFSEFNNINKLSVKLTKVKALKSGTNVSIKKTINFSNSKINK